jgi:AcrR family transcriptional regulator
MSKGRLSRETLLPLLAAHVLEHGLGAASLRPLAEAAATSDRMLIYHFGTKEVLIADLLSHIAGVYAGGLSAVLAEDRPSTRQQVISRILAQNREPAMQPFMALWWEIVAGSARGLAGYRAAAQRMVDELLVWLEAQMPPGDPDPASGARYLLVMIEGAMMLSAVGHARTARAGLAAGLLAGDHAPS